jgi:RNA polymerase sigma-70 factor (ECF subfamily)
MARELPYSLEEVMRILLSSLTSQPDPRFEEVRSHLDGTWKAWSRDDHLADDASQETWAKMLAGGFRKLEQMHSHDRFSSVRSLEAYLFLAFRNQWRDLQRARRRAPEAPLTDLTDQIPSDEPPPEEQSQRREILRRTLSFMDALDPTDKSIFYRHFVEGLPDREIAIGLALSRDTVAAKLKRWRKRLRERLEEFRYDRERDRE